MTLISSRRHPRSFSALGRFALRFRFNFWEPFLEKVSHVLARGTEPIIRYRYDQEGNSGWQVFDPVHQHYYWMETEAQVREWIEQRYRSHCE